jgi:hypothetical protein
MRILVDENIPLMAVEQRLLITTDRGFSSYRDREHYGILIITLRMPNRHKISSHVAEAMKRFSSAQWKGLLVVMRDKVMSTWSQTIK